jgi:uncharacterized protein (DUF2225 family)
MMNLFAGLEKFGFSGEEKLDITKEEKTTTKKAEAQAQAAPKKQLEEKDFLLDKKVKCPVCDKIVVSKQVKSGKMRLVAQDDDLRPKYAGGIDPVKYDVIACPNCGHAAFLKSFEHLSATQIRLIKEGVASKFTPVEEKPVETYSYDKALERYKLALVTALSRRAKLSEKSYLCLKISWLLRSQIETMPEGTDEEKAKKKAKVDEYNGFYRQAFDGFIKAMSSEMPPYYGIQTSTLEYMLSNMALYFKEYDVATKLVGNLISSAATPARIKDKSRDLKDKILEAKKTAAEGNKQ